MCDDVMSVYQNLKYILYSNINSVVNYEYQHTHKKRKTELSELGFLVRWCQTAFHKCKHCSKSTAIINSMHLIHACIYLIANLNASSSIAFTNVKFVILAFMYTINTD